MTTEREIRLTPREVDQVEAALDAPTPIDPADIRPGDVVERREVVTVRDIEDELLETTHGISWYLDDSDATWHLVSRPDPDAETIGGWL